MSEATASNTTQHSNSIPPNVSVDTEHSVTLGDIPAHKIASDASAYIVLEKEMHWWHFKAEELYKTIVDWLNDHEKIHNRSNANLLVQAAKALADYKVKAADCASKLISFQAPKLQAVELNAKSEHRFVVVAPKVERDSAEWLQQVTSEQRQKVIDVMMNTPIPGSTNDIGNE